MKIKFLGTGGGRFVMITQKRRTGGMLLKSSGDGKEDLRLYIDPGPGALVYSLKEGVDLKKLDGLIVTHAHLDHCNDAEAIIEAMTHGCKEKRGVLIGNSTVLKGLNTEKEEFTQEISTYHQNAVRKVKEMKVEENITLKGRKIQFFRTKHGEPNTMAFKIKRKNQNETVGFITDSALFDDLLKFFSDCSYLIINVLRPKGKEWEGHLNINDVAEILNHIRPKKAILHHFGYSMLYSSLKEQKEFLEEKTTESEIIFAKDFQEIPLDEKREGLGQFMG